MDSRAESVCLAEDGSWGVGELGSGQGQATGQGTTRIVGRVEVADDRDEWTVANLEGIHQGDHLVSFVGRPDRIDEQAALLGRTHLGQGFADHLPGFVEKDLSNG